MGRRGRAKPVLPFECRECVPHTDGGIHFTDEQRGIPRLSHLFHAWAGVFTSSPEGHVAVVSAASQPREMGVWGESAGVRRLAPGVFDLESVSSGGRSRGGAEQDHHQRRERGE